MSLIGWIIVGIVTGIVASRMSNSNGTLFLLDTLIGVASAIIAGSLYLALNAHAVGGAGPTSVAAAAGGAIGALWAYHFFFPRIAARVPRKIKSRWSPRKRQARRYIP